MISFLFSFAERHIGAFNLFLNFSAIALSCLHNGGMGKACHMLTKGTVPSTRPPCIAHFYPYILVQYRLLYKVVQNIENQKQK
jgi:hypothetical protein